jgi:hypothetical protein
MANAFERMGGHCLQNPRRATLLMLAEHIINLANRPAAEGRPPPPFGKGRPKAVPSHAPLGLKALASAHSKGIGQPFL